MVSKVATSQSAKRKKSEEMEESPPKRVTRARTAKAVEKAGSTANAAKSKKPATRTQAINDPHTRGDPSVPVKSVASKDLEKRGTRSAKSRSQAQIDPSEHDTEDTAAEARSATNRSKRQKASEITGGEQSELPVPPQSKGRQTRATGTTASTRSKAAVSSNSANTEKVDQLEKDVPNKKPTRSRTAAPSLRATTTRGAAKPSTNKRVKFQEDVDKENACMQDEPTSKLTFRATGLRAKPVRKPPVPRNTVRGRRATQNTKTAQNVTIEEVKPLSPKKIDQVAKASSMGSDDELATYKSPPQSPLKSPLRHHASPTKNSVDSRHNSAGHQIAPRSPIKASPIKILDSPAKRPPPSPLKDGLTASPKRIDLAFSPQKSGLSSTLTKTPMKTSLLAESPRKIKLSSTVKPTFGPFQGLQKSSMLQSPARRPLVSPFKLVVQRIADEEKSTLVHHVEPEREEKSVVAELDQKASSPLKGARSPERTLPVHRFTPKAQKTEQTIAITDTLPENKSNLDVQTEAYGASENPQDGDTSEGDSLVSHANDETMIDAASNSHLNVYDTALRRVSMESGSTDELTSPDKRYAPTPIGKDSSNAQDFRTPSTEARAVLEQESPSPEVSFTPLVGKMSEWMASSPSKSTAQHPSRKVRGVFSLEGHVESPVFAKANETPGSDSPFKTTFFEDEIALIDNSQKNMSPTLTEHDVSEEQTLHEVIPKNQASFDSVSSEEYGDENAVPTVAEALREEQDAGDRTLTCTPAKVFTPEKIIVPRMQEVYTVSKVPLRACAEESPMKLPRQRSKSIGGALTNASTSDRSPLKAVEEDPEPVIRQSQPATPRLMAHQTPRTPVSGMRLDAETPGRTVRKGVVPDVLKGAVVYVDVHTSEGADASGIFIDLLTQMGARCVKQWTWNPRASLSASANETVTISEGSPNTSPFAAKVGITHVVYKDGGKRTLEKVRLSNGVVLCVGVGWVLE